MSLIKFPSHIKPSRVTVQLQRVDEIFASPLTNIQQVVSRGNPAWRWTYEYRDISLSEREVVQSFLMNCRGSLNTFKVPDAGDYVIRGSVSDFTDIFSGYGSFKESTIQSYFTLANSKYRYDAGDDETVRVEHRYIQDDVTAIAWNGHSASATVDSLDQSCAYVSRIKHFQNPDKVGHRMFLRVGSAADANFLMHSGYVTSSGVVTVPFITDASVNSINMAVAEEVASGSVGDYWRYADYELKRCALVVNSEQLLTQSNNFAHADWTAVNVAVESGWMYPTPTGVTSDGWMLIPDTKTNTWHYIESAITKQTTEDFFTVGIYAKKPDDTGDWSRHQLMLEMRDSVGNEAVVQFHLGNFVINSYWTSGAMSRINPRMYYITDTIFRCGVTALASSLNNLYVRASIVNSQFDTAYTANGSSGIEVLCASVQKHPFFGPWIRTTVNTVVGSDYQTGSRLVIAGVNTEAMIKAGTRFEVINQFHINSDSTFERSEFKRITADARISREGWGVIEFDPPIHNAPIPARSTRAFEHLGETMHNPVIFHEPEMKARLINGTIQYIEKPLQMMDVVFDVIEDLTE